MPSVQLQLHGSRATGVAGPLSDIDLFVASQEPSRSNEPEPRFSKLKAKAERIKHMEALETLLRNNARFKDVELLASKIPTLKAIDVPTGLTVQFITNVPAPVLHAREFASYFLSEFPQSRPLYTMIRHALQIRGLTTVFDGGIGSYPLLIMIVAALNLSPRKFESFEVVSQLIHVLKFWADADTVSYGFAADPPLRFPKFKPRQDEPSEDDDYATGIEAITKKNRAVIQATFWKRNRSKIDKSWQDKIRCKLSLQDPANPVNDLGEKATAMKDIQAVFRYLYEKLQMKCKTWDGMSLAARMAAKRSDAVHLISPLVKARYVDFIRARIHLRQADPDWYGMDYVSRDRPSWDSAKLAERLDPGHGVAEGEGEGEKSSNEFGRNEETRNRLTDLGQMIEKAKAIAMKRE